MELTIFILLGVIVLVALLTRRVAAQRRDTPANPAAPRSAGTDNPPKYQEPPE
ncbi:MAG TPA: hypothetical protein PLG23_13180 [Thermoflexales bacterium]|jgi:hypothetical protein|nr:hypothetical protein [Anaerolineae bacterium]HQV28760.1 hypothetical protein [Thermoflexales bacterium]HQX10111.1 hypothetical protein [Thermoflexales bacterium]HQZ54416.1 hypothetical protein [Thermoflexales bacterium]